MMDTPMKPQTMFIAVFGLSRMNSASNRQRRGNRREVPADAAQAEDVHRALHLIRRQNQHGDGVHPRYERQRRQQHAVLRHAQNAEDDEQQALEEQLLDDHFFCFADKIQRAEDDARKNHDSARADDEGGGDGVGVDEQQHADDDFSDAQQDVANLAGQKFLHG